MADRALELGTRRSLWRTWRPLCRSGRNAVSRPPCGRASSDVVKLAGIKEA